MNAIDWLTPWEFSPALVLMFFRFRRKWPVNKGHSAAQILTPNIVISRGSLPLGRRLYPLYK